MVDTAYLYPNLSTPSSRKTAFSRNTLADQTISVTLTYMSIDISVDRAVAHLSCVLGAESPQSVLFFQRQEFFWENILF